MAEYAQRVGRIINYVEDDKKATFEVVPPGKEKGYKASAFLEVGENWDSNTRSFKTRKPNPVVVALRAFTNADNAKTWRVGGTEKYITGGQHSYRVFNATTIELALPTDDQIYTMDKDGNPLDTSNQGTKAMPVANGGTTAPADEFAPYICAAAEILAKEGGSQALTPVKVSDLATILVAARDALAHDFRQGGDTSEAATEPVPF